MKPTPQPTAIPAAEAVVVRLGDLSIDPTNVRKTGRGEEPKFAASIRKRGVLEPMLVRGSQNAIGSYTIINGGERFTALQYLKTKKEKAAGVVVTDDYPVRVEVTVKSDAEAHATSLATNLVRSAMHPVDEFEAFAKMIQDGATVEQIAAEYAMKVPEVRAALSLAAIAPEIRKAWREGLVDGEAAEAYAQTRDLAHQVRVFQKLKKRAGKKWAVDEEIAGSRGQQVNSLLRFVGQKDYEAAGHQVNPSLFGDDDRETTVVNNVPALKAMASAKLDAECEKLKKDGWGWAIHKDAAPKDIYSWRRVPTAGVTKEQKALAGCTVDVSYNGSLEVERGYVKPGVSVKIEKTKAQKAAAQAARPPKSPTTISAALATRVSEALTLAVASVVADGDHDMALRLALAGFACTATYGDSPVCLDNKRADRVEARDAVFETELARLSKLGRPELLHRLAQVVASSIDVTSHDCSRVLIGKDGDEPDVQALVHHLPQKVLQAELRKEFDVADYFDNAPAASALGALADMAVAPLKNVKKAALAKQAADHAKKAGWLPKLLRTEGYEGPVAKAKPKKAKAAGRKKRV